MANKYWVGGTGNWDGTTGLSARWSNSDNGAGGVAGPGTADSANFTALSGGGTVTITGAIGCQNIIWGAFTGTIDNSGNHDVALSGSGLVWFTGSGTATRTFTAGNGTYTLTGVGGAAMWNIATATNLTASFASATIVLVNTGTAATSAATFQGGGLTYGTVTLTGNVTNTNYILNGANTFNTLNITAPNSVTFPSSTTTTINSVFNWAGTSSDKILLSASASGISTVATISSNEANTLDWGYVRGITFAQIGGVGSFTADNSFDLGCNTLITVNEPSGGGSSGVIGG